jgi:predicted Holliday junction resolvase-like endonuclease
MIEIWENLTIKQKLIVVFLGLLLVSFILTSWINTFGAWREVREFKRQAEIAREESAEALARAAELARDIQRREKELVKLEVKKNRVEKKISVKRNETDRARANYNRARTTPRPSVPSTAELCRELAELGYPC